MSIYEQLAEINRLIDEVIIIFESSATWKVKFELIFAVEIHSLIDKTGLQFYWSNPDMDYEDDVTAYINSLKDFRKNLGGLLHNG